MTSLQTRGNPRGPASSTLRAPESQPSTSLPGEDMALLWSEGLTRCRTTWPKPAGSAWLNSGTTLAPY